MRSKRRCLLFLGLVVVSTSIALAQSDPWAPMRVFEGRLAPPGAQFEVYTESHLARTS